MSFVLLTKPPVTHVRLFVHIANFRCKHSYIEVEWLKLQYCTENGSLLQFVTRIDWEIVVYNYYYGALSDFMRV